MQPPSGSRGAARRPPGNAFTLVELLVVIAIMSLLLMMLMPLLVKAREIARRAACMTNTRRLLSAVSLYNNDFRCLPPWAVKDRSSLEIQYFWYQRQILGQYIGEDIPLWGTMDGWNPPRKSATRCPSAAAFHGLRPTETWIGFNVGICANFGPTSDLSAYWRGAKYEEFKNNPSNVVVFQDARSVGFWYVSRWAYNDRAQTAPPNVRLDDYQYTSWPFNVPDFRHDGGVNYGFADGHAAYILDPDAAFAQHQIQASR
jgi:prepilin-type processing-associated H-X9-DG protein/prepilin-type N-terminal cleavage/methylation domain-containing protein